ncbi:MAG TPA: hypothetical protein VMT62_00780 [Syntrophorhabdaceae bacterium]|nr:hypothetical protein [Syntrophorhabdaceae bacterium]
MVCVKCGQTETYREYDRQTDTEIFACFKCGFRKYKGYPMQPADFARIKRICRKIIRGE